MTRIRILATLVAVCFCFVAVAASTGEASQSASIAKKCKKGYKKQKKKGKYQCVKKKSAKSRCKKGYKWLYQHCYYKIKPKTVVVLDAMFKDGRLKMIGYATFPKTTKRFSALFGYARISNAAGYQDFPMHWLIGAGVPSANFGVNQRVSATGYETTAKIVIGGVASVAVPLTFDR